MAKENPTDINEASRVPLKFVLTAISATIAICAMFYSIDSRLANIEKHIPADWMVTDQENWALRLQNHNPELVVPDVRDGRTLAITKKPKDPKP